MIEAVGDAVAVALAVGVAEAVGVSVDVPVGEAVAVTVGDVVAVGVSDAVGEAVAVAVAVAEGVGVTVGVGVREGVGVSVGTSLISTMPPMKKPSTTSSLVLAKKGVGVVRKSTNVCAGAGRQGASKFSVSRSPLGRGALPGLG